METTQIYEQNIFQLQKQVQELMIRISVLNKEKLVLEHSDARDYHHPFCEAAYSNGATGWKLTDWFEQLVSSFVPESYSAMWDGSKPFDNPHYVGVMKNMSDLFFHKKHMLRV